MAEPVDLLLITWNRREYIEKTLPQLLASRSDFRLYCWDNASADGTADIIAGLDDPRVVEKYFARENVAQREPSLWFLDRARSDVVGKVDDDILLPDGWIDRIAPLVRGEPRFGMLGCWIFMPSDWDEALAAPKIIEMGGTRLLPNLTIAGQSFLARKEHLVRYIAPPGRHGFPVLIANMSVDGLVQGFPLPLLMAHNMDDPRSPHCLMNRPSGLSEQAALTYRTLGFPSLEAYVAWIAADARRVLTEPLALQLRRHKLRTDPSLWGRVRRRLMRLLPGQKFSGSGPVSRPRGR